MDYPERLRRLVEIRAGREQYGDGGSDEQAQRYQLDQLLEDLVGFARTNSGPLPKQVDLLISMVGFSPITTVMNYLLLRPRQVLAITSSAATASLNVIFNQLQRDGLSVADFHHRSCEPTNPQQIYRIVKEGMDGLLERSGKRPYAVIDITGGRKVMSAAAALVAWQLNLDLCYLDSEFDRETQLNRPETNRLLMLANPITIFGEQEMARADEQFRAGAYEAAAERYRVLAESVREPTSARFKHALSALYQSWCDLELGRLAEHGAALRAQLERVADELTSDAYDRILAQLNFTEGLAAGDQQKMALCYYLLGMHYAAVGRRDFAALFYYRTMEKCFMLRLRQRSPDFVGDAPQYSLLDPDVADLSRRYCEAAAQVWPNSVADRLPTKVGLMDAALLLRALHDEQLRLAQRSTPKQLRDLGGLADARNRSVLAHGEQPVTDTVVKALGRASRKILEAYWKLSSPSDSLYMLCDKLAFLRDEV
jgi:hypothetical protein